MPDSGPAPSACCCDRLRRSDVLPELQSDSNDPSDIGLAGMIAAAADLCRKPLRHAVVLLDDDHLDQPIALSDLLERGDDLRIRLECRDPDGARWPDQDLELEMYRSGDDLNLMLGWWDQADRPLLWQGQHPVWMDGNTGLRCAPPQDASSIESLARRLRSLLC